MENTPDEDALLNGKQRLTYRELNLHANRYAHYLVSLGVGAGSLVGVCLGRSADLVAGVVGIG